MGAKGEKLATDFEQANEQFISVISGLNDAQWKRVCDGESWSVGVTAHHIAGTRDAVMGLAQLLSTGPAKVEFTADMLNQSNAEHAKEFADVGRDETVALARASGTKTAAALRAMEDAALDNGTEMEMAGGRRMTAADLVQGGIIGHTQGHLESIRKSAGG